MCEQFVPAFIPSLIASFVAVVIVLILEARRKPKLYIETGQSAYHDRPDEEDRPFWPKSPAKFVRAKVSNQPMPFWIRWAFSRETAYGCFGFVEFFGGGTEELLGRMRIRWSNTLEPVESRAADGTPQRLNYTMINSISAIDIASADGLYRHADIAVRFENDPVCYGWNNESYRMLLNDGIQNLRPRLGSDTDYFVRVTVFSQGSSATACFTIDNPHNYRNLELREVPKRRSRIRQLLGSIFGRDQGNTTKT